MRNSQNQTSPVMSDYKILQILSVYNGLYFAK